VVAVIAGLSMVITLQQEDPSLHVILIWLEMQCQCGILLDLAGMTH
jgi:hypothetical protein